MNRIIRRFDRENTVERREVDRLLNYLYACLSQIRRDLRVQNCQGECECEANSDEEYISLSEFFLQNKICTPNTISRLLSTDEKFFELCGKFERRMYFIKPTAALNYLALYGSDRMKRKVHEFLIREQGKDLPPRGLC